MTPRSPEGFARGCKPPSSPTAHLTMRFSRTQLVGALALLAVVWLVILLRLLFPAS